MRVFTGERLVLASHNAGKLAEIEALVKPLGISVTSAKALSLPEPEETETSFAGNARLKAHAAASATGLPALSDDSGLEVDALDGAPGVYTADWAETGSGRDFAMAMEKVLHLLKEKDAPQPWRGRFKCTLCIAWPDGEDILFEGATEGVLVWPPRGEHGHGYDPMFMPEGRDQTFAEMDLTEKQEISHRARAFAKLRSSLEAR